jgi:hypothetical protein
MCAYYEPPTEIDPIFNSLAFQTSNDASLTLAEADLRYLARQNVATSVASATSFTGEVAAPSWTSISSGATTFHLDNLPGNNASLVIRNQRTDKDTIYRQLGTTNSHIFQTDGTTTTNLTLSKTLNTSSLPLNMSNQQINDVAALTSLNSPTASMTISNSANNTGGMVIQNANTASNIRYNQFGTSASHIFSTNNTATTNLTLSNTMNTSSLPFTFSNSIILQTTAPTNTAGYLGYTVKQNGTNTAAIATATAYNNNATGLSITPGVYVFHFLLYNSKLIAGAGDINEIQVGISTSASSFVGGDTTIIKGFQTYVATASAQVVMGNASLTFSVPTTATYYFLQQASHTIGATNLIGTTTSYWEYTRVA